MVIAGSFEEAKIINYTANDAKKDRLCGLEQLWIKKIYPKIKKAACKGYKWTEIKIWSGKLKRIGPINLQLFIKDKGFSFDYTGYDKCRTTLFIDWHNVELTQDSL
jgi:hypothetical protein